MDKKIIQRWHDYYSGKNKISYKLDGCKAAYTGMSLNMAKVVSQSLSTLIWSESPNITVDNGDAQIVIDDVLDSNKVWDILPRKTELMASDGGFVAVVVPTNGSILVDYYDASKFNILRSHNDNISRIEFINCYEEEINGKCHTVEITETHDYSYESYVITNVAKIDGEAVNLDFIRPDLEEYHEYVNIDEPFFTYFKSPLANNIDVDSAYGISIYANALDTLDSIDHAYTHKKRDIIKAQTRLFIGENALTNTPSSEYDKSMGTFNIESDDAITVVDAAQDGKIPIEAVIIPMKTDDLIKCINKDLETLSMQTGFSAGTFNFDGSSVKTATEVISQESDTYRLKSKFENIVETCLISICNSIMTIYGIANNVDFSIVNVEVEFKDVVSNDKTKDITNTSLMVTNKFMSRREAIMILRGMTSEQAMLVIQEIDDDEMLLKAKTESNKKVEV